MYYPGLFGKYHISIEAFYVGAEADAEAADYGSFLAEVGSVRADTWQHADTFDLRHLLRQVGGPDPGVCQLQRQGPDDALGSFWTTMNI